jgi:hypothetical protein
MAEPDVPAVSVVLEYVMRKSVLFLAIVAAASAPASAFAAKSAKPAKPRVVSTTAENMNELSVKLVAEGVRQIFVPLQVTLASASK